MLDIDECNILHGVCGEGECQNVPGSFECLCKEGFTNGMTKECIGKYK